MPERPSIEARLKVNEANADINVGASLNNELLDIDKRKQRLRALSNPDSSNYKYRMKLLNSLEQHDQKLLREL